MPNKMYKENRKTINWFVGCEHHCVYCRPSFQRQMMRQKQRCLKCYNYEPHAHLDRLIGRPPKTKGEEFIFFPSSGDLAFASISEWARALEYVRKYPNTKFLIQSKNPSCFIEMSKRLGIDFPDNILLATTIETNQGTFDTPSKYQTYTEISQAPSPHSRYLAMLKVQHKHKMVTIEPILDFDLKTMIRWIKQINPEIVYVGYDNHKCKLPEPKLAKTELLIKELSKFTEVRVKTLRKAWYEA